MGNGLDSATDVGPLINEDALKKVMKYVSIGQSEGAKLVLGGHRLSDGPLARGWFHEPTIFGDCTPKMRICREEIFGPVVSVMPVEGFEEALAVANDVAYGLSASIYTRNVNWAFQAMRDIYTGIVYVNAPTIGAEIHLPFGGTKQTGNGHREAAVAALDFYSEWKTLYIDYSDRLQRAQIDTETGAGDLAAFEIYSELRIRFECIARKRIVAAHSFAAGFAGRGCARRVWFSPLRRPWQGFLGPPRVPNHPSFRIL